MIMHRVAWNWSGVLFRLEENTHYTYLERLGEYKHHTHVHCPKLFNQAKQNALVV